MKSSLLALVVTAGAALFSTSAAAQTADPVGPGTLIVSGRLTVVSSDADDPILTSAGVDTGLNVDVENDVMPTLGFTYFVSDHWAVEAILGATQHQISAQGPGTDIEVHNTWVLPPVVTLQYRPNPNGQISPYVGAGVNAMIFFSGDDQNGFTVDLDNGLGWAVQAGADVQLTGPWGLNLDVKKVWFNTDATINGGALQSDVNLDPWVVSIGLTRRF